MTEKKLFSLTYFTEREVVMEWHQFGEEQTDQLSKEKYRKCSLCGHIMFSEGDEFFNLVCNVAEQRKQNLRKRLESSK
jgi:hypothetical protein